MEGHEDAALEGWERVKVSRDAEMNSPISSCVSEKRNRMPASAFWPFSLHSSSRRASLLGRVARKRTGALRGVAARAIQSWQR